MPVSFQVDAVVVPVPDEQVDLVLEQLDRPQKYAPALVGAIDDVERKLGVSPPRELRALRTLLLRVS